MTAAGLPARVVAFRPLRRVHERDSWSAPALHAELQKAGDQLGGRDRAFAANLAYDTLRWEGTLDWALGQVVDRPLERVEQAVLDVLRIGAWQILRGNVPPHAAVATTVDLARSEVGGGATGFVNGVLRALQRRATSLPWPDPATDRGLALATGYPEWIVAAARQRFGERATAVLEAGNRPAELVLRATGDRRALLDELRAQGLDARPGLHAPEAVVAPGADPGRLAAVADGRAVPQDEASMLVTRALVGDALAGDGRLAPGTRVLDVAAGPGGKSTHLAQLGAWVAAADLRHGRAKLVAGAAARLGLGSQVHVVTADGRQPPWKPAVFDAVLLDAPCTGLGVVRRRPELRWRRRPGDAAELARLQLALLERASAAVRPGGRCCYSVCTWTSEETAGVVSAFLAAHGDRFAPLTVRYPRDRPNLLHSDDFGVQLDPEADSADGMYICLLQRKN
jgi:16S rRNA (cytosine967-C5)-methyltransferase